MATTQYSGQNVGDLYKRKRRSPDISVPRDDGCEISPSRLSCSLPQCLWDYPLRERAQVKAQFLHRQKLAILGEVIQRVMQRQQERRQRQRRGRPQH